MELNMQVLGFPKIIELFSGFLYLYYESEKLSGRRWCNMRVSVLKEVSSKS
jgi:hypothetical protein